MLLLRPMLDLTERAPIDILGVCQTFEQYWETYHEAPEKLKQMSDEEKSPIRLAVNLYENLLSFLFYKCNSSVVQPFGTHVVTNMNLAYVVKMKELLKL